MAYDVEKWVLDDLHIIKDAWRSLSPFYAYEYNENIWMIVWISFPLSTSSLLPTISYQRKKKIWLLGYFWCSVNYITHATKLISIFFNFYPSMHEYSYLSSFWRKNLIEKLQQSLPSAFWQFYWNYIGLNYQSKSVQLFYALKCNLLNSTIRTFYGLMITVFYKRSKSGHLCRNLTISLFSTNKYHYISEDFHFTFYVCMHNEMLQWTRADVSKKRLWEKRSEVKVKYNKKGCTWLYSLSHEQFTQS